LAGKATVVLSGKFAAGAGIVVKLAVAEYELHPPVFEALTLQEYEVANESGPTCLDVEESVESSNTIDENAALCDTCKRYVVAPADAFHDSVTVVGWFDDPLPGDERTGGDGAETNVVKFLSSE